MKLTVQFFSEGASVGPSLLLPGDSSSGDLLAALRSLNPDFIDGDIFFAANKRIVGSSLYKDCVEGTGVSVESVIGIECIKTESFMVKPVSRTAASLSGHQGPVLACHFSTDGRFLATGSGDKSIRIWDTATMTPQRVMSDHRGWVLSLAWSPCNIFIASGDSEGNVYVWSKDGELISLFSGHKKWITYLSWEPVQANARLVSASKDGTCRIWSIGRTGCHSCLSHNDSVTVVRWIDKDTIVTGSHDRLVRVWNPTGVLISSHSCHAHWINFLATNRDYSCRIVCDVGLNSKIKGETQLRIATSSDDKTLILWDEHFKNPIKLVGHQHVVNHVSFSPSGKYLASASFDKSIKIWCGLTGKFVGNLRGHVGAVYQLAWSADSRYLVSVSKDSTAKLWDVNAMKLKNDLPGHLDEVYCVDWAPSGQFVATCGKDQKVIMYSLVFNS